MSCIKQISRRKNIQGQVKFCARFRIQGKQNPVQFTLWAKDRFEVEREVYLRQNSYIDNEQCGLTWAEGKQIWYDKVGRDMSDSQVNMYTTIINQFTKANYEVSDGQGRMYTKKGWGGGAGLSILATTARHISDFMDWRREDRRTTLRHQNKEVKKTSGNSAANKAHEVMLALARALRGESILPNRPLEFESVKKRKHKRKSGRSILMDQLPPYLEVLTPEARLAVEWALHTGWRSTPTCSLLEGHIDEPNMTVHQFYKGGKDRSEPLDEVLLNIVYRARELKRQKQTKYDMKRGCTRQVSMEYVFVNTRSRPWNHDSLLSHCQKAWEAAGLPHKTIHELRTTFGTEAGKLFPTAKVQKALGHDSIQSTEHYIDQDSIDILEVGKSVRSVLQSHISDKDDADQDDCAAEARTVTLICPELGKKCSIIMKEAVRIFGRV